MIKMEQQPFAPIQKSETKDKVPDKCQDRNQKDVPAESRPRTTDFPLGGNDLTTEGAVSVHMFQINIQVRIAVMEEVIFQCLHPSRNLNRFVHRSIGKASSARRSLVTKQAQL